MKSPITSKDNGFTLIETIMVIAIVSLFFAMWALIDSKSFTRESLADEEAILISSLYKARSQAMNNIEHKKHGVYIESDKFVIFESPYDTSDENNEEIERNENITISGLTEISFEQLSGVTSTIGDIVLTDGTDSKKITITSDGLIDW
jgi:prepilin-type N-terminal cleavage/methylation domain-containing protein